MSSQPLSRTRQRRQRYSGITQPRAADFVEQEAAPEAEPERSEPLEGWAEPAASEPSVEAAGSVEAVAPEAWTEEAPPAELPARADRREILEEAKALTRETRRAGQLLSEITPPSPWSVGEKTRFKLLACLAVLLAAGAGYYLRALTAPIQPAAVADRPGEAASLPALTAQMDAQAIESATSAAFAAMKQRRFADARARFSALQEKHPRLKFLALEVARAYLYEGNFLEAQRIVERLTSDPELAGEAYFILGLVQLTERNFSVAATSFRHAIQAAPSRADAHYMAAEAQRRAGKIAGASAHYQAALDRNQVETNELTYRLKLWISQIQDETMPAERFKELAESLARPGAGSEPVVVEAARLMKASDFAGCARRLEEAGRTMEPLLFRVVLMDPFFSQEAWRPELAPLYKR